MKWKCEEQNERKNSKLIGDDKNGFFLGDFHLFAKICISNTKIEF